MIDLPKLRELASKAAAIDATQPDREHTIYYDYPGCPKDQECLVATAWCVEWARWIAATTPEKVLSLCAELEAARAVARCAKSLCSELRGGNHDARLLLPGEIDDLLDTLAAYDAAIAGQREVT